MSVKNWQTYSSSENNIKMDLEQEWHWLD